MLNLGILPYTRSSFRSTERRLFYLSNSFMYLLKPYCSAFCWLESAWKLLRKDISFSRLSWSDRFASMGKNELDYFSIWFREPAVFTPVAFAGDCGGNDSGNHGVQSSLADCKTTCQGTSGCQYYCFWTSNNYCYPKHTCSTQYGTVANV